mgnify:CR=1 FL=1
MKTLAAILIALALAGCTTCHMPRVDADAETPTAADMDRVIDYLDRLWFDMGVQFIPAVNDCKHYASLKAQMARMIVQQSTRSTVAPAISVAHVYQTKPWAGIPVAPMHAVVLYETSDKGLRVWEPQNAVTCPIGEYPNEVVKVVQ